MLRPDRTYVLPAALIAAFLAVGMFAIITYVNTVSIRRSEETATQAYAVREAAYQILSAMKDAEIGQRGFLLTNDSEFLQPYNQGVHRAAKQIAQLIRLTTNNQEIHEQAVRLQHAFDGQRSHLADTIELREQEQQRRTDDDTDDAAIGSVKSNGQAFMTQARKAVEAILEVEERKLANSEESTRERTAVSRTTITIGNLLAIGLISFAGFAAVVDRRKRDLAERELRHQQNELEAVIESAFEGILTFGDDLIIRYMNPAAAEILRVDPNQVSSRKHGLLDFVPKQLRQVIYQRVENFNASGRMGQPLGRLTMLRSTGSNSR